MSEADFKVVVAGCGGMANEWVKNALVLPGLKLVGLYDIRRQAAEQMARKHNLPTTLVYDNLAEAIQSTGANLVFDVTIPDAHAAIVTAAVNAGCDVIGEKPLSSSMESARQVVDAVNTSARTYAVMQNYRCNPNIAAFRAVVQDGRIGTLEELHADMFVGPHFGGFRDEMDFPLLLDMGIHTFDAARFISGADPVNVYCHSYNPDRSWYKGDASAVCIFEMSDGRVFTYRGSWCAEGTSGDWSSQWRAIGSQGSAEWDGRSAPWARSIKPNGTHGFFSEMQDIPIVLPTMEKTGHAFLLQDTLTSLRGGRPPATACQDNIKSLAMVFAAVDSAKSGKKVPVTW